MWTYRWKQQFPVFIYMLLFSRELQMQPCFLYVLTYGRNYKHRKIWHSGNSERPDTGWSEKREAGVLKTMLQAEALLFKPFRDCRLPELWRNGYLRGAAVSSQPPEPCPFHSALGGRKKQVPLIMWESELPLKQLSAPLCLQSQRGCCFPLSLFIGRVWCEVWVLFVLFFQANVGIAYLGGISFLLSSWFASAHLCADYLSFTAPSISYRYACLFS